MTYRPSEVPAGLTALCEVDNRRTPMPQKEASVGPPRAVVRAAMNEQIGGNAKTFRIADHPIARNRPRIPHIQFDLRA